MYDYDVFLSHSSKDQNRVRDIAQRLKSDGLKVWFDEYENTPGIHIPLNIEEGLKHSRVLVLCMSRNAFESNWVTLESQTFRFRDPLNKELRFIPLRLDNDRIEGTLAQYAYIDWRNGYSQSEFEKLIQAIKRRDSWEDYEGLISLQGYIVAYLPLFNECSKESKKLNIGDLTITRDTQVYSLPDEFQNTYISTDYKENQCCRLASYDFLRNKLKLTFSETAYGDYLRSGEHLDKPSTDQSGITYRKLFADLMRNGQHSLRSLKLTNIVGVGCFIMTSDNKVIISRQHNKSHVYPSRLTFASSGVMNWGACPHPFTEIIRKSNEEICHQLNPSSLKLVGFGADARKLYFQFSFVETSKSDSTEIIKRSPKDRNLEAIPFEPQEIAKLLIKNKYCWEPAAEAVLLTLAIQHFSYDRVLSDLKDLRDHWAMRNMKDEWDFRAGQPGLLPVMSVRYPECEREKASEQYIKATMDFMGSDIADKRILEVGCGIGRMTTLLLDKAKQLKSIDLCERMIGKAKTQVDRLDQYKNNIEFECCFAEDYKASERYDVAICSLIFIHNTDNIHYSKLIKSICENAKIVFVFEDVTTGRPTSPHTHLRSSDNIIEQFERNNFRKVKTRTGFKLFDDILIFLKFVDEST